MTDRKTAAKKAALARKRRTAGKKAALTRKRRQAARKAAATRKWNQQTTPSAGESNDLPSARALTIRQPWAELIIRGRKPYEIRSWRTRYRGPLLIQAAAKLDSESAIECVLNPHALVTGAFVGIAFLTDVRAYSRKDSRKLRANRAGGGWYPGLFSWVLTRPRRISPPIKAKGRLGLIKVPPSVLQRIGKRAAIVQ
jgi:hypothetical protein